MTNLQLQVERYRSVREMESLREEWDGAVASSSGEISLTYEWFEALEESHFGGKAIFYLLFRREGLLHVLLPVAIETTRFAKLPVRKISFLANAYCNHNDLIVNHRVDVGASLCEALPLLEKHVGGWDLIEIDEVMADSPRMAALEQVCRKLGYPLMKRDISKSPYIPLGPDFDLFFRSLRSGDARRKIRRLEERLRNMTGFGIRFIRKPEEIYKAMEDILEIERASWKANGGTDIASNKYQIAFYTRLAELASKNGWLDIALLSTASRPMAYEFNLRFGRRCFHLKGSYHSAFKEFSPSKVLKKEVLRISCEDGLEEYDYTGQEQEHKLEWTDKMRRHQHWLIFNRNSYAWLLSKVGGFVRWEKWQISLQKSAEVYYKGDCGKDC